MSQGTRKTAFLQGNIACAEGALAAGCQFFAGYPITPSSEIAEFLSAKLPAQDGVFIQMEDEIAAMGAVIGGSLAGLKSLTATSGPGFSLKQENLGFAVMAEVPCVVVNVMRGGPSTGLPTMPSQADVMQARWGRHGDHQIIALVPDSVQEIFFETIRAFNLAEKFRTPVILLMDEVNGHMREKITFPLPDEIPIMNRVRPSTQPYVPYSLEPSIIPPIADFGTGYRYHVTGLCHDETGFPTNNKTVIHKLMLHLHHKIVDHRDEIVEFEQLMLDDARIAVFAYGSTARAAKGAVNAARANGIPVGLFRPKTLWPFPDKEIAELAARVDTIIVAEMNLGQMICEVERTVAGRCAIHGVNVFSGKPVPLHTIFEKINEVA